MYPEPCFRAYFHDFFMIIFRIENNEIFATARNVTDNYPAISFGMWALVRDVKDKKPLKNHDFPSSEPSSRPARGAATPGQSWNPKSVSITLSLIRSTKNGMTSKNSPVLGSIAKIHSPYFFIAQNSAATQLFAASRYSWFSKNPEFSVPWKVCFLGT